MTGIVAELQFAGASAKINGSVSSELFLDANVVARRGTSLSLFGPNGCGKTSIARALLGLIPLRAGLRKHNGCGCFAYMPQDYRRAFLPWLSLARNLDLRMRKCPRQECDRAGAAPNSMREICEVLKLQVDLTKYPGQISGGELQLLLWAAVVAMPAELRVFDEPFSALDFRRRRLAREVMSKRLAFSSDAAWLVVTHDPVEAVQLAHTIAVIGPKGSIVDQIDVRTPWPRLAADEGHVLAKEALARVRKAAGLD